MAVTKKTIYQKLFEAKKEIGKISKDSTNPFFKSKYFDINTLLEHVEPILQKNGLIVLQPILDGIVSTTIINIDNPTERVESNMELPELTDPQKLGSAITYYRRYTLQSLLALQGDDDDGNKAAKAKPSMNKEKYIETVTLFNEQEKPDFEKWEKYLNGFEKSEYITKIKNIIKLKQKV